MNEASLDFWVPIIGVVAYAVMFFGLIIWFAIIHCHERACSRRAFGAIQPHSEALRTDKASPFAKATPPPRSRIKRRPITAERLRGL